MRNWYMNMAPWDRPRECEAWLPDFLGDKKFFDEDDTISAGFYFPGTPRRTLDFYRTLNFTKRRSAPDTTVLPALTKRMKPTPRLSVIPSDSVRDSAEAAPNGTSTSSQKPQAPPRRKQRVSEAPSRKVEDLP
ncbi:hypothetical protein K443DRAFT_625962 [Laccaria amethystina LaAM-08-1]|uniref:Unplaced genomic scaffold K443scaffold_121, whole genome shotgun sequence n=1 Tax=Laccaria amethystina LaAM-08-1 TaxID=1095629 RepID=A0A0C9X1S3_9AGAR|nr:hypothetical protein K443DRAFT_625962 [Laccaria amethystina LaAM-08-1]